METILRVSKTDGLYRWANGDNKDWYWGKDRARKMTLFHYYDLANKHRTLYSTLSYFDVRVFDVKFSEYEGQKLQKSCEYVKSYTFGVDIDTVDNINGHGVNIREPEVKQAVEAAAQFFCDRLRKYTPNSVHCLFSGGGIYVFLHHGVLSPFFDKIALKKSKDEYIRDVRILMDALNIYAKKLSDEFFVLHPKYKNFVKIDLLNGAKRIFKTIFSIHKRHNFAVIPLDPLNVKIDFDRATLPLSAEVIEEGKGWYRGYDETMDFLNEINPFLNSSIEKIRTKEIKAEACKTDFLISETKHDFSEYPPCIKYILSLEACGTGATRALTFLATFLGHIEPDQEKAYQIWIGLARRWNADAADGNIFGSHYKIMHCASCTTLNTLKGGFPYVDIVEIGACKPDLRCMQIGQSNPINYTDNKLYVKKLEAAMMRN